MPAYEVDTTAAYQEFNFLDPLSSLTLTIAYGTIYANFRLTDPMGLKPTASPWELAEPTLIPGVWTFDPSDFGGRRIVGVRVRYYPPPTAPVPHVSILGN